MMHNPFTLPDTLIEKPCRVRDIDHPLYERNIAIHEAAHCAVGLILGFPMGEPVFFTDGTGMVPFDPPASSDSGDGSFFDFPPPLKRALCLQAAAMFLAGCEAEARAQNRMGHSSIVYCQGHDLDQARKALGLAGLIGDDGMLYAAVLARSVLDICWPGILEAARMLSDNKVLKQ